VAAGIRKVFENLGELDVEAVLGKENK
jgi:hypothetical protein